MAGLRPLNNITKTAYFPLRGGLKLEDPPLERAQGTLSDAVNFECVTRGGYRRLAGYERYDGQGAPSEASYWILNFDAGTGSAIVEGDIVTGLSTGQSGEALIDAVLTSGTWGVDAAGYLVLTSLDPTLSFTDNEDLQVSAVTAALADGTDIENGAALSTDDAAWSQDAIETARSKITAVTGSGPIRGIAVYNGDVYAFRNNAGGTACAMWKATTAGWAAVSLGQTVEFTLGTAEFLEGETLTQGGVTATILRVCVSGGVWGSGNATGHLVIDTVTGGPYAAGVATSASGSATLSGAETTTTLPAGGRYEFNVHNYYANADAKRLYGVNGVGRGFEWDGTVFAPIATGNTTDTPQHLEEFKEHLFFAFPNGSLQHSGTGTPCDWTVLAGAAEIGIGDDITLIQKQVGGTLGVFSRNKTAMMYGSLSTGDDAWQLKILQHEAGAIEWTGQEMGESKYLDDRGLMSMSSVQAFGDFKSGVWSQDIESIIDSKRGLANASIIVKKKNQYRLFFTDNTGVIASFSDRKLIGITTLFYSHSIECCEQGENSAGAEVLFFGDSTGYVFQMDKGTSFDGGAVTASMSVSYTHMGSPSNQKQFRKITMEVQADASVNLNYQAAFDYGSSEVPTGINEPNTVDASGGRWDVDNWDEFVWSAEDVTLLEGDLNGTGRNVGINIYSESTYIEPYTVYGISIDYSMRRLIR